MTATHNENGAKEGGHGHCRGHAEFRDPDRAHAGPTPGPRFGNKLVEQQRAEAPP